MTIKLILTPVPVTEVHISHGVRRRCYSCPMALAIDDLLIDGYSAEVSPHSLVIHEARFIMRAMALIPDALKVAIPLPPVAIRFMEDFDDGKSVSPKVFTILLPRHLLRNPVSPMEVRS